MVVNNEGCWSDGEQGDLKVEECLQRQYTTAYGALYAQTGLENKMTYDVDADFQWFLDHQGELVEKYRGRTLAIRNSEVIGDFASEDELLDNITLPIGEYMIQLCEPGERAYTTSIYTPDVVTV